MNTNQEMAAATFINISPVKIIMDNHEDTMERSSTKKKVPGDFEQNPVVLFG